MKVFVPLFLIALVAVLYWVFPKDKLVSESVVVRSDTAPSVSSNPKPPAVQADLPERNELSTTEQVVDPSSEDINRFSAYSVFESHLPKAKRGVPASQFQVAYIAGNCSYAETTTDSALLSEWENSDYYHTDGPDAQAYKLRIEGYSDCKQVTESLPRGIASSEWSAEMMNKARESEYASALVITSRSEGELVETLLKYPESLMQHPMSRIKAMGAIINRVPAVANDRIRMGAWEASICNLDPECDLDEGWNSIENLVTPVELENMKKAHSELEAKMKAGTALLELFAEDEA